MAAPAATVRSTPTGKALRNGFRVLLTLERFPDIAFYEKELQPSGEDGGEPIDTTTQHSTMVTKAPNSSLSETTDVVCTCAYDPGVFTSIRQAINVEDEITVKFADGSTQAAYGFLRSFVPDRMTRGQQPTATATIVITNWDPVNDVEAAPVVTSVTGT